MGHPSSSITSSTAASDGVPASGSEGPATGGGPSGAPGAAQVSQDADTAWCGYLVWSAPADRQNALGLHKCDWAQLEERLGVPASCLAGQLGRYRVGLKKVSSMEEARLCWQRSKRPWPPPEH